MENKINILKIVHFNPIQNGEKGNSSWNFFRPVAFLFCLLGLVWNCKSNSFHSPKNVFPFLKSNSIPKIISFYPGQNEKNIKPDSSIQIFFNKPMNSNNCQESFSISPQIRGSFENNSYFLKFTPNKILDEGTYVYRVNKSCEDTDGNDLETVFSSSFSVGDTQTLSSPELSSIQINSSSDSYCNFSGGTNNLLTDTIENLCLNSVELKYSFTQEMNKDSTRNAISLNPSIPFTSTWSSDGKLLTIKVDKSLQANTRYSTSISTDAKSLKGVNFKTTITASFKTLFLNFPILTNAQTFSGSMSDCLNHTYTLTSVLNSNANSICPGTDIRNPILLEFSEPMDESTLITGLSMNPAFPYQTKWQNNSRELIIVPDNPLVSGTRYTFLLTSNLKSKNGTGFEKISNFSFLVGTIENPPRVQAIGLESQNCPLLSPGIGSSSGGDWTLNSCFWDYQKPILQASNYLFRGGDSGTGFSGSSNSCADVNTDNFLIFFDQYMNPNSVSSIKLQRISPPFTTIKLSNWTWFDCQSSYPYGCKIIKLIFSEQEASCNGNLFGTNTTLGDFNLSRTDNSPSGFSLYTISIDNSAKDVNGNFLKEKFEFSMEGR